MDSIEEAVARATSRPAMSETFNEIPLEELVRRATRNARSRTARKGQKHPRWVAVMDTFALGSTYAHDLCRRFNLDPDELIKR